LLELEPNVQAAITTSLGTPDLISQIAKTEIPSSTSLFAMPTDEQLLAMKLLEQQILERQKAQQDLTPRGR